MAKITLELNGIKEFESKLASAVPLIRANVRAELYQFAEEIIAASKLIVPVDTGTLMNTGKVMPPQDIDGGVTIQLGYGDASAKYALFVHENMSPNVKWTRPGSGPKYLETPLKDRQDSLPARLGSSVMDTLKKA